MNKMYILIICVIALAILFSCENNENQVNDAIKIESEEIVKVPVDSLCFLALENKDSVFISLRFSGDQVRGNMAWMPFEKDGSKGSLTGSKNSLGEYELIYDYVIEGSNQTETIIMKIERDSLFIKEGELEDPNFDGNLVYKDVTNAVYGEGIASVPCK